MAAPWLAAQQDAPLERPGHDPHGVLSAGDRRAIEARLELGRVPIHTHAADPDAGPYGWWAAGPGYKASFHDGFVFYPRLGRAYPENLPLRWTTETIAIGSTPLAAPSAAEHVHTDWRYEYRYGAVTEAYDVREDGVEQTFVVHQRPPTSGDLVIRGRIDTRLCCEAAAAAHQPLTFTDSQGNPLLRYGEAVAIDASGRRIAATTALANGVITLAVPADWLAAAVYPVTVDPLSAPVLIRSSASRVSFADVAHDAKSHETLIVSGWEFSATDWDTYGYLVDNNLGGLILIFSDLAAGYTTAANQCAFVGGANKWVIACNREFTNGVGSLAVYVHQRAHYAANSGYTKQVLRAASTYYDRQPSIGGTFHPTIGGLAALVWRRDVGSPSTDTSRIWGTVFDVLAPGDIASAAQSALDTLTTNADQEWPCINKCSEAGEWLVLYQEYDRSVPGDDWDIDAAVVLTNGAVFQRFRLGSDSSPGHKILPKIEGNSGRYFYSFTQKPIDGQYTSVYGTQICAEQFDWTGTLARRSGIKIIDSSAGLQLTTGAGNRGIAYDRSTVSHAAVAYQSLAVGSVVQRIGFAAASVERWVVGGGHGPGLVYNPDYLLFVHVWGRDGSPRSVFAANFTYEDARCLPYGPTCGGRVSCANAGLPAAYAGPHRGSSLFYLQLRDAWPNSPCVPVVGFGIASILLPGNCTLLLDPGLPLIVLPSTTTTAAGTVDYLLPISEGLAPGDMFAQWAIVNPLNQLQTSNGMQMQVR